MNKKPTIFSFPQNKRFVKRQTTKIHSFWRGSVYLPSTSLDKLRHKSTLDTPLNRKIRRFYHRFYSGINVGGQFRLLTLTSSDEAVEQEFDIHQHWEALVMRLKRRFGEFEWIGVCEEEQDRKHLHIVFRGEYIKQAWISGLWNELHKSPIVDIRYIRKVKDCAKYLAKYLAKAKSRYWMSHNWVFKGWIKWSKKVKRLIGRYPSKTLISGLARLDKKRRDNAKRLLEMIWIMIRKFNKDLVKNEQWLGVTEWSKR